MSTDKVWVVLACPRSGTHYTAHFFLKSGFSFAHERLGKNGGCGWNLLIDPIPAGSVLLHQVRHPKNCIHRLGGNWDRGTMDRMTTAVGGWEIPAPGIARGVEYWVRWNRMCAERTLFTFKVEDLNPGTEVLARIKETIGLGDFEAPDLPKNIAASNGGKRRVITRADVLKHCPQFAEQAFTMAEKYGYEWE